MTPFEHTIVTCLLLHRRLGEKDGAFMPTPALNALPRRVYYNGKEVGPAHPYFYEYTKEHPDGIPFP